MIYNKNNKSFIANIDYETSVVSLINNILREDSLMSDWNNRNLQFAPLQDSKGGFLQRPKLHALLEEATQKHVVTIVAGPGYGKSTIISSFLADHKKYTGWLPLTELDNLDTRIWEYLCSVFRPLCKDKDHPLFDLRFPTTDFDFYNLSERINQELEPNKRYYLVLDDYYKITNPAIHQFIEKFISMWIPNLCIIIISRQELPINTVSLLSKNLLFRITDEVLRLTKDEMTSYFLQQGILLTEQAISEFYRYTGGWFFTTHLVCLSLEKNVLYKTNPLNAVKLDIFSLLESEVYSILSEELKDLLLRLSLVTQPPLELAIQFAGGQQDLVYQIMNISSFVTFDGFTNTVCIHQLFLDFLQKKQDCLSTTDKQEIFMIAAQWYEKNEYRIDAITYYERIERYDIIIDILLTFTRAYPAKTMDFLFGVINRMPDELLAEKPIIRFLYIKFLMNNYNTDDVNDRLLELRQELEPLLPTPERIEVLGELYTHLAFQSMVTTGLTKTYEFADYFETACEYLPNGCKLIHNPHISAGNYICNVNSPEAGGIDNYIDAVKKMLPAAKKLLPNTFEGLDSLAMAEYAYFRKDTKEAEKYIYQAIWDTQNGQSSNLEIYALFLQTRISVESGNYAKAMNALERQSELIKRTSVPEDYTIYDITMGWFHAQLGNNNMVPHWIKDEQQSREVMSPVTFAVDKLVRAKCLLNDNAIAELLTLLSQKSEGFTFEHYLFGSIEMKVIKAIALSLIKEYKKAGKALQEAYELALPNKIVMPFIENGKYTESLIKTTTPFINIPSDWLEMVQKNSTTYAKRLSNFATTFNTSRIVATNKPNLSRRESEILMYLCQNCTRDEIASSYSLSVSTVRSIISNIYSKLGVNNNIDAVRVATQLGLL